MAKIIILKDYRNAFYSTVKNAHTICSMDVSKIESILVSNGHEVEVKTFSSIDLVKSYDNYYVLYQSSEDPMLLYKSYIEDVLLCLMQQGATLIPDYLWMRAHHNKVMMEILRASELPIEYNTLHTRWFGTYEELVQHINEINHYPVIFKSSFGAGSTSVYKANGPEQLLAIAKKRSISPSITDWIKEYKRRIMFNGYISRSLHRQKFIVQTFVPQLSGDFKVLQYGKKFYILYRENRIGDFRASGSGRFNFNVPKEIEVQKLLDYACNLTNIIKIPVCSIDIGFDGENFHLFEYQCVAFGPLTMENSTKYYTNEDGKWIIHQEKPDLENTFAQAISDFIQQL